MSIANLFTDQTKTYQNVNVESISLQEPINKSRGSFSGAYSSTITTTGAMGVVRFTSNFPEVQPPNSFIGFTMMNENITEDSIICLTIELDGTFSNSILVIGLQNVDDGECAIYVANFTTSAYTPATFKFHYIIFNPTTS